MATSREPIKPAGPPPQDKISKKYRDRPANEGKHGDAAEEPNSGVPSSPEDAPRRANRGSSRQ